MTEDYSGQPASLNEKRAMLASDPAKWGPRELLVSLLRRIDSGELLVPDHMVVCYGSVTPEGYSSAGYLQAGTFDAFGQIGLLHTVINSIDN